MLRLRVVGGLRVRGLAVEPQPAPELDRPLWNYP